MYPISDEAKSLLNRNYHQIVSIRGKNGAKVFELTESDIAQGGLSINRYCVSGNKIEIGSAVASELTLKLDNRDDRYADTHFEGVELEVQIGIKKWDAYKWENAQLHWIPCGFFTVDETPRKLSYITLTALDRMVRFDKEVKTEDIIFPTTIATLLRVCCENCRVPLQTNSASLTNADYVVKNFPESDGLTYRRIIQWIAEISGTCAYVDWDGKLCFGWYGDNDFSLSPSERYSSDMYEQDITITGVQITDEDDNTFLAGTDDYAFNIENNGLIQDNQTEIATAIYNKVVGFTYRPYTCTCKPLPYVYPLDGVSYTDKHGVKHNSIVTGVTFKMNASTSLEGKGETTVKNGYASANPLTKGEAIILKKLETRVSKKITNYEQASLDMNEMISNSLGLYRSMVTESNGSTSFYYHNAPTIGASTIIYTFKANGFAWTNKWEDDDTVWQYGVTRDGNAVLNILSVLKLNAEQIDATDLHVKAANIDGVLNANQINAKELKVAAANITGKLTASQISVESIVGAINENGSELSISVDHIELNGKTLTAILEDYVTDDGLKNELTQYVTSSQLTTTLTSYAKSSDGVAESFAYTLKSSGLTCKSNGEEVLSVDSTGLHVKGIVEASSGSIGKLILTQSDGYYSSVSKSEEITKTLTVTIPQGTIGYGDGVTVWFWYAAVKEFSLADLGITDTNAVLGEFTIQPVDEISAKAGLAGCSKSGISLYAMVRGKGNTLDFDRNINVTIKYCYYNTEKTQTTVSKLCSPDSTFDISSALSASIFSVKNIRADSASINSLNSPSAILGGITFNKECISANGINITFDSNSSTTVRAEIVVKGNVLFIYCDTVIYFDKILFVKYSNADANFDKTISVLIKGGTSFAKVEVPTFNEITSAEFVDSTNTDKTKTSFIAETPDDAAQYAYEERILYFDNPQLCSTGYYNSTYSTRIGGALGSANNYWNGLYAYNIYGINIYQNGTAITTSDKNLKNTISYFDDTDGQNYSDLFDKLRPASFKYNNGEKGRTHWGFIAQDIEENLKELGLDGNGSAIFCEWEENSKSGKHKICGIRYEELIPILTYEIQKLKKKLNDLSMEDSNEN